MVVQHVNRRGDTYYLHQGTTKTGKPKWFFSTKREGRLTEVIPESYEVYENHNAQVFLRKTVPRLVTDEEVAFVENAVRRLARLEYFFIEVRGGSIVVCLPDQSIDFLEGSVSSRFGIRAPGAVYTEMQKLLTYSPMMRFTLTDEKSRCFSVERWCFLGSIDDWFLLTGAGDLSKLVAKYTPHLGNESFYELM